MTIEGTLHADTPGEDDSSRLYREGCEAKEAGDLSLAITRFEQSSLLAPHFKTYELLGDCLVQQGKPKEAVLFLAAAAGLGNKPFRAHYLLARAFLHLSPPWTREAAFHLQEALRLNPQYKSAGILLDELLARDESLRQTL